MARRTRRLEAFSALVAALAVLAPSAAANVDSIEKVYFQRAAMAAIDDKCKLLSEGERLALVSGMLQSRGALLREGVEPVEIADIEIEVKAHALKLGCRHSDVASAVASVKQAFKAYSRTGAMEYRGAHAAWNASRSGHDRWAVSQTDKTGRIVFGLRRDPKTGAQKLAVTIPADPAAPPPPSAQLVLRDPSRLAEPWLGTLFGSNGKLTPPPRSMSRTDWAGNATREADITGAPLLVFYFTDATLDRFEKLDPREAVTIEIAPPPRAVSQAPIRHVVEVGDFVAAATFAVIPDPWASVPEPGR